MFPTVINILYHIVEFFLFFRPFRFVGPLAAEPVPLEPIPASALEAAYGVEALCEDGARAEAALVDVRLGAAGAAEAVVAVALGGVAGEAGEAGAARAGRGAVAW